MSGNSPMRNVQRYGSVWLLDAFELWLQNTYPKVLKRSLT